MQSFNDAPFVLVGEDEPDVCWYLEVVFKSLGYRVELAQDADEVLNGIQSSNPEVSVVLLDAAMNRAGTDVLCEIRRTRPRLPVIMISGVSSMSDVITAMKHGATDFLCKPLLQAELRDSITRALNHQPIGYLQPA